LASSFLVRAYKQPFSSQVATNHNHDHEDDQRLLSAQFFRLGQGVGARPTSLPRHVRVARGRPRTPWAPDQGIQGNWIKEISLKHNTPDSLMTLPLTHRLFACRRGPSASRARLPGPRRLRRRLARSACKPARSARGIFARCSAEERFARRGHQQSNKNHKAHALRAWRCNAKRMARRWQLC
jgi:hypothetical protein